MGFCGQGSSRDSGAALKSTKALLVMEESPANKAEGEIIGYTGNESSHRIRGPTSFFHPSEAEKQQWVPADGLGTGVECTAQPNTTLMHGTSGTILSTAQHLEEIVRHVCAKLMERPHTAI